MIKHIRELNKGNDEYIDSIIEISPTVELIKLWDRPFSEIMQATEKAPPSTVYFIKDGSGLYVGGVQDGGSDLHWVILPECRKKGYLAKSMKGYILPHIFQNREILKITIDRGAIGKGNFMASEKVTLALGFKKVDQWGETSLYELKWDRLHLI